MSGFLPIGWLIVGYLYGTGLIWHVEKFGFILDAFRRYHPLTFPQRCPFVFKVIPALQVFDDQRLGIFENLNDTEQYKKISSVDRLTLRDTVCSNP